MVNRDHDIIIHSQLNLRLKFVAEMKSEE